MEGEEGDDDTVGALLNAADRYAGPLCHVFRRRGVAVVTGAK
jgi:hypothetical protein